MDNEYYNHTGSYLKLKDAEIYYETIGNGPPLIFVHGLGGNHLSWFKQIPFFMKDYTCIVYSQRGFGLSSNHSNKIDPDDFADDLDALIRHLDLKQVNIVAQSMGGWTSLNYALRKGNRTAKLIMADTTGELNFNLIENPEISKIPDWLDKADKIKSELKKKGLLSSTDEKLHREDPSAYFLYAQLYKLTPDSYRESVRQSVRSKRILYPDRLKELKMPVYFIAGDADLVFPPAAAVAAASIVENAQVYLVPGCGHSVYFERPDLFNSLILKFLRSEKL